MLKFELTWDEKFPKGDIFLITSGSCTATLNNKVVWDRIPSTWVDFLEHLTKSWDSIFMDSALKPNASTIDQLEFELNHDLSRGIKGKIVPSILIYRYGNGFEIQIGELKQKLSYNDVSKALTSLGNTISLRLTGQKAAKTIIENWNKRKIFKNG